MNRPSLPVLPLPTHRLLLMACMLMLTLLTAMPAAASLKSLVPAGNSGKFLTAEQAFQLVPSESVDGFFLDFRVTPGHYLYRERFRFENAGGDALPGQPVYSTEGEWKEDPTFGRVRVYHDSMNVTLPVTGNGQIKVTWQGCADAGLCYPPQDMVLPFGDPEAMAMATTAPVAAGESTTTDDNSRPMRLFLLFALGLGLAFTPCVLPMLPILAGIIARQHTSSAGRGFLLATAYVLGVATVYALIGFVVGFFGQQVNLPGWFQQAPVLIVFALLFFTLALSLFGLFELRLPAALTNHFDKLGRRQQGGALIGSFLIGVFSALVVSPCVSAPLFGVLLHVSTTGNAVYGAMALFVMALGMGVPLLVLGATEGRLLPKAGAWMNEVKTFFGLLLLVVAAELLSRLVPAPVTLGLYGLCTAAAGFWLWQLRPVNKGTGLLLRALAFCVIAYAGALVAGAASGGDDPLKPLAQISSQPQAATATPFIMVKTSTDLDREIANAQREGKAVMLDFYADWCVSCKVMERHVFRKPEIADRLSRLHLLQADVTANDEADRALLKRFSLLGPPTIIFFDANGHEISQARLVGEKNARDFLSHLNQYGL